MRYIRDIMGMPVQLELVGTEGADRIAEHIFDYLRRIDDRFSTYKTDSEISRINRHELTENTWSDEMREVFALAEETKRETHGYFDITKPDGTLDPSGLVKGWAIKNAAQLLKTQGVENFYIEVAGDMQTSGVDGEGKEWRIGILNPITQQDIVKVITPRGHGVATSGTYLRGSHLYDPHTGAPAASPYLSLTVIGPDVYDADRMATAAFAMGADALPFLSTLPGYEAYAIAPDGIATMTSGFSSYAQTN